MAVCLRPSSPKHENSSLLIISNLNQNQPRRPEQRQSQHLRCEGHEIIYVYDRVKQAVMAESDRPIALREAIMACRNGVVVSVIGVYGGLIDKFPIGSFMNRSLTMRTGQCHVQHYWKGLLDRARRD